MQRADRIIVAGIAVSGLYGLLLLPLFRCLARRIRPCWSSFAARPPPS